MNDQDLEYFESELDGRRLAALPISRLGVVSFAMAFAGLVLIWGSAGLLVIAMLAMPDDYSDWWSVSAGFGVLLGTLFGPLGLVVGTLAVLQKGRRKTWAVLGLCTSLFTVACSVLVFVVGGVGS